MQRDVAAAGWKVTARITVFAPADDVVARINPAVGVVEVVDENTSVLITGADMYETIALYIGLLGPRLPRDRAARTRRPPAGARRTVREGGLLAPYESSLTVHILRD